MTNFDDIRPYNDSEVKAVIDRVVNDKEFRLAVARLQYPRITSLIPGVVARIVGYYVKREARGIDSVEQLQMIVRRYIDKMLDTTGSEVISSGIERLDPKKSYLFVSNHRDITLDPALLNWVLNKNQQETLRIAIGDNLLSKPYVTDLMRLNKSFIVKRSVKGNREKFKAAKHLSEYIHHSLTVDKANVWIAQREGRAKNGLDRTNTALVGMLSLNKPKTQEFADYIRELHIVPISMSYEWDPCDGDKAREIFEHNTHGKYEKEEHEDVLTIAKGISGSKGKVRIVFGDELTEDFNDTDEVAAEIDRQVINNYAIQPSNYFAYKSIYGEFPPSFVDENNVAFKESDHPTEARAFVDRLRAIEPKYRQLVREMYANPIVSKLQLRDADHLPQQKSA